MMRFGLTIIGTHLRRAASALSLLVHQPSDLLHNVFLTLLYLWNKRLRHKNLVVLVRTGGVGDLACVLASVPGLRAKHPNSWIVIVSPPGCRQLVACSRLVDAAAEAGSFFHRLVERSSPASSYYQPYLPDEYVPPRAQTLHLVDEFAHLLGVTPDPASVRFQTPNGVRRRLATRLRRINPEEHPVIVLHPGPTWPVREWPFERWCALAQLIHANTACLIIRIGTDIDSMRQKRPFPTIPRAIDWTNQLSVIETLALLEQATAFIGIDSGPLHLAGIVGVPAVGLFGAISADRRTHPRANTVSLAGHLDCIGCHHNGNGPLHWRTGCPHDIACMREIHAEAVFATLTSPSFTGKHLLKTPA